MTEQEIQSIYFKAGEVYETALTDDEDYDGHARKAVGRFLKSLQLPEVWTEQILMEVCG